MSRAVSIFVAQSCSELYYVHLLDSIGLIIHSSLFFAEFALSLHYTLY